MVRDLQRRAILTTFNRRAPIEIAARTLDCVDDADADALCAQSRWSRGADRNGPAGAEESHLASAACDWLAGVTSMGVRLLAAHFVGGPVLVSCAGAVATCPAMSRRLAALLEEPTGRFDSVDARLEPVGGAVLLALRAEGVPADDDAVIESIAHGTSGARAAGG